MRHRFEISQKGEFLSKIMSFLPLKFEYTSYIFPIPWISFTFYDPAEQWFYFFAKVRKGSYVFCFSSLISFNLTSHFQYLFPWIFTVKLRSMQMFGLEKEGPSQKHFKGNVALSKCFSRNLKIKRGLL